MISFDFSKSLAPQDLFERYADQVATTHQALLTEKKSETIGWWHLPFDVELQKKSATLAKQFREKFETLLVIGIGGSSQGLKTLTAALAPGQTRLFIQEAPDADSLKVLLQKIDPKKTAVNVVSKSGNTIETLALLEVVEKIFEYKGCKFGEHLVITTEENDGKLFKMVQGKKTSFLPISKNVGGRFSVFSPVGLFGLGFLDVDIDQLIQGTQMALERGCVEDPSANSIYHNGLLHFHFVEERKISAMMTYSDLLRDFGGWYAQLWGESLGKNGRGQTPVALVGPQDQHSVAQLILDGPKDKIITFVNKKPVAQDKLSALMHREASATAQAFCDSQVPCVTLTLPDLSPKHLGELLMSYQIQTAFVGHLMGINPYDQPAVERIKKLI